MKTPHSSAEETVDISHWGSVALLRDYLWISTVGSCSISEQFSGSSQSHLLRKYLKLPGFAHDLILPRQILWV